MTALVLLASVLYQQILSSTSNFILMVIHGGIGKLAYYKPADQAWTTIKRWHGWYFDVAWYKGQFHALYCGGRIESAEV